MSRSVNRFIGCTSLALLSGLIAACTPQPQSELMLSDTSLRISQIPFQDANFKACVQEQGTDLPNEITQLDCSLRNIASADELIYFPALKSLDLSLNRIQQLDLSANQQLTDLRLFPADGLKQLRLSHYPNLNRLALDGDNTSLPQQALAAMPNLNELTLGFDLLQQLEISHPKLEKLSFIDSRALHSVTLDTPQLKDLYSDRSQLKTLDLSRSNQLVSVEIKKAPLQQLTLGQQPKLEKLWLEQGQLTGLQLGQLPKLTRLLVSRQQLKEIDLSGAPAIRELDLDNNQLRQLNLNAQRDLTRLYVKNNPLPRVQQMLGESSVLYNCIDSNRLDYTVEVFSLNCLAGPDIERVDFNRLSNLREINLRLTRGIKQLDLRALTGLETVSITSRGRSLEQIRLPNSPYLTSADLHANQLKSLNLSQQPKLSRLNLSDNPLQQLTLDLPALQTLEMRGNPILKKSQVNLSPATLKALKPEPAPDAETDTRQQAGQQTPAAPAQKPG